MDNQKLSLYLYYSQVAELVDAKCWLEWRLIPQQSIHSYRFESCPDNRNGGIDAPE